MEGVWPIIFLGLVLKIPVFFGLWLVWWAVRAEPQPDDAAEPGEEHGFRRWRREPKPPRGPRRGPHGGSARALPDCPPAARVRVARPPAPVTASATRRSAD
jgi:hypothetical protein